MISEMSGGVLYMMMYSGSSCCLAQMPCACTSHDNAQARSRYDARLRSSVPQHTTVSCYSLLELIPMILLIESKYSADVMILVRMFEMFCSPAILLTSISPDVTCSFI